MLLALYLIGGFVFCAALCWLSLDELHFGNWLEWIFSNVTLSICWPMAVCVIVMSWLLEIGDDHEI